MLGRCWKGNIGNQVGCGKEEGGGGGREILKRGVGRKRIYEQLERKRTFS